MPSQMAPDGSFPRELARTKPYGYAIFQLDNMSLLSELLSTKQNCLWRFTVADEEGITLVTDHRLGEDESLWSYEQAGGQSMAATQPLLWILKDAVLPLL